MTTQTIPEAAANPLPAAANDAPPPHPGASAGARVAVGGDDAGPGPQLEHDELAALAAFASGATRDAVARKLGLASRTYGRRLADAVDKLGASCTINAVFLAAASGQLTVEHVEAYRRGALRVGIRRAGGPSARHAASIGLAKRKARYAAHRDAGATPQQAAKAMDICAATRHKYEAAYIEQDGRPQ